LSPVLDGVTCGLRNGILGGIEFVDVNATVETGSYHEGDSNEAVFREAAEAATNEALRRAKPALLEGILAINTLVPEEFTGFVQSQLSILDEMEPQGKLVSLTARFTASQAPAFMKEVLRNTQGTARFSMRIVDFAESATELLGPDNWAALT
jgi:elongation factor G